MTTAVVQTKPAVKSTQNWANVAIASLTAILSAAWPAFGEFISNNPEIVVGVIALINILWRTFITEKKIRGLLKK